jgi:hypothetical protein
MNGKYTTLSDFYCSAEKTLLNAKLDGTTTMCFLEYITTMSFTPENRLSVAVLLKNKAKKRFGVSKSKKSLNIKFV